MAALLWATAPQSASLSSNSCAHQRSDSGIPLRCLGRSLQLWLQRLPQPLAQQLCATKRSAGFQLWGEHAGAPPYLMLRGGAELDGLPHSLRLGHYRLVAADALSLKSLQQSLVAKPPRASL